MVFWVAAALLTLAASLAVMLPFLRNRERAEARGAHDLEVYRDQLGEIDSDMERGLIAKDEAEEARAEIGRRILRVADGKEAGGHKPQSGFARIAAAAAVLAVPVISWGLYSVLGSPGLPAQPLEARLSKDPAESSIGELVARAERHLAANPGDGRGWEVLAPVYFRMERFGDAATAYRNAIRYSGATADREAALGEAIVAGEHGLVSAEAAAAFERALELESRNAKARFFLAMAQAQEGNTAEAVRMWDQMEADLPADSPWRGVAAEASAQALASADRETTSQPGPTREQVAAAEEMSQEDRAAMIEGMVAGLAARLKENPADAEGWRRLVRSYVVLERPDDARSALERGVAALGEDSEEARELTEFAAGFGVAGESREQ